VSLLLAGCAWADAKVDVPSSFPVLLVFSHILTFTFHCFPDPVVVVTCTHECSAPQEGFEVPEGGAPLDEEEETF
jgi:hypothetical protein